MPVKSPHRPEYQKAITALIKARKAEGITQQDLAKRLGRPQSFVSKYENGERRLDVIEYLEIAKLVKADLRKALGKLWG